MMNPTLSNSPHATVQESAPEKNDNAVAELVGETDKAAAQTNMSPEAAWHETQDKIAEDAGIAALLIDGHQPPSLAVSNNNSVCRVLQSSGAHAHLCEPFCGKAFENVQKAGGAISYRCHAGLQCVAAPLAPNVIRPLAVIVGRAFARVADYQNLLERIETGDLRDLPESELSRNFLFAETEAEIYETAARFQNLDESENQTLLEFVARTEPNPLGSAVAEAEVLTNNSIADPSFDNQSESFFDAERNQNDAYEQTTTNASSTGATTVHNAAATGELTASEDSVAENAPSEIASQESLNDFAAWQLFTDSLLEKSFKAACGETLRFLSVRFDLKSLAWLERSQQTLKVFLADEPLRALLAANFELSADDARLHAAALDETAYRLVNPVEIELFPMAVGDDIRAAIAVGDQLSNADLRYRIARFCRQIAVSLEVLRLREELARRAEVVRAVQLFNEKLNVTTEEALFDSMLEASIELMHAERGSLLVFDENEQKLRAVAAVGSHAQALKQPGEISLGERIAERVFREGAPVVIENLSNSSLPPAPPERDYKSNSFICFPLTTNNRTVGVLNLTDKRDGSAYSQTDLDLLEAIAPQLAVVLDRAAFQERAGMFERLSITDSLTGLLNRRYLNERLSEEVNRSNRDGSPMSFMMIDIDNFKSYNDRFGHQAGDEVLRMTAQFIKSVLRSADVAARYGGEEFSAMLPQTTLSEARLIGERIRERVENAEFPKRQITVSIGIAAYSPFHNTPDEIIEAADKALYQAKRIGKNNVQLWLFGQTRR